MAATMMGGGGAGGAKAGGKQAGGKFRCCCGRVGSGAVGRISVLPTWLCALTRNPPGHRS